MLIRRLIGRITVFDEKYVVKFKSGLRLTFNNHQAIITTIVDGEEVYRA